MDSFAVVILTHGRPDNVKTTDTLRRSGYTGRIIYLVDDLDDTIERYRENFGNDVIVFDKRAAAEITDTCDNFDDLRAVVYARNAVFEIMKAEGVEYFLVLDDDYSVFNFRFNERFEWTTRDIICRDLDTVFAAFVRFLESTPTTTITMAQGGDYIGGTNNRNAQIITLSRKAMNSWFCKVDRPIDFLGRINEDTNAYCARAHTGMILFTCNQVALNQAQTQQQGRGLTDIYKALGTYVKSFYTVVVHPSGARVKMLRSRSHPRIHHEVNWRATTPMIVREKHRKASSA